MREKEIEKLANDLEEPRAVRLLAEWLAIEHDKTRLQGDEYMEAAQELYDYLLIIGFRLIPLLIEEIKKVENPHIEYLDLPIWLGGMANGFEDFRQKILKKMEEK